MPVNLLPVYLIILILFLGIGYGCFRFSFKIGVGWTVFSLVLLVYHFGFSMMDRDVSGEYRVGRLMVGGSIYDNHAWFVSVEDRLELSAGYEFSHVLLRLKEGDTVHLKATANFPYGRFHAFNIETINGVLSDPNQK